MSTELGSLIYTLMLNDAGFEGQVVAAKGSFSAIGASATKSAEEVSLAQDKQVASMAKSKAASEELHTTSSGAGSSLNSMALGAAAVAVSIGFVADKTVKAASDYQEQLTGLVTGAGENEKNIGLVGKGLLDMSAQTGTTTKQLTDGMFMIESAGYHGADGLKVLQAAAEGAKVGQADLGTVADATTTIMKDYGGTLPTQAVNELIATVANGKTHMADLSMSLSQVLPTASAAKVGLHDVMGAMATMTGEGVPAANAATYLRQTIIGLSAPGTAAKKALQEVGLSSEEVSKDLQKSLPDTLKTITEAVGKKFPEGSSQYIEAIKAISGGSKTMQGMLDLTGGHMKDFTTNVESVGEAVHKGGDKIEGWNEVQKDFSFKMAQAKASIDASGIALGTALMPALSAITGVLVDLLKPVTSFIANNSHLVTTIMEVVGAASVMVLAIVGVSKAIELFNAISKIVMATNPILLALMAVALIAIVVVNYWKPISAFFMGVWASITKPIGDVVSAISGFIGDVVQIFQNLFDFFTGGDITLTKDHLTKPFIGWVIFLSTLRDTVVGIFQKIIGFFVTVGKDIANVFNAIVDFFRKWGITILAVMFLPLSLVVGLIIMFWKPITAFFQTIWNGIKAVFAPVIGFFSTLFRLELQGIEIVWGGLVSFFTGVWNGIVAVFSAVIGFYIGIYKAAWDGIVAVWNVAAGFFGKVWSGIVAIFTPVVGWFIGVFQGAWNGIKNIFGSVYGFFAGVWGGIVSIFTGVGTTVGNAIGNAFRSVVNGVVSGAVNIINGFISAIDVAIDVVNKIPGVHIGALSHLSAPHFANGTSNYPGGWGIMNEMGGELVKLPNGSQIIPADKTSKMMGNTTSYNFGQGSVILQTAEAVNAFFNIGNRNTQLEGLGLSPLAGTTRV